MTRYLVGALETIPDCYISFCSFVETDELPQKIVQFCLSPRTWAIMESANSSLETYHITYKNAKIPEHKISKPKPKIPKNYTKLVRNQVT